MILVTGCIVIMDKQQYRMLDYSPNFHRTSWRLFLVLTLSLIEFRSSFGTDLCPKEYRVCSTWDCPRLSPTCHGGRGGSDPCDCCTVCLRQVGERCSVPKQPCDAQFGLYCKDGRCRGMYIHRYIISSPFGLFALTLTKCQIRSVCFCFFVTLHRG